MGACCSVVKPNDGEKINTDLNVHFNRKKILLEAVDRQGLKQNTMENPDAEEAQDMITSYEDISKVYTFKPSGGNIGSGHFGKVGLAKVNYEGLDYFANKTKPYAIKRISLEDLTDLKVLNREVCILKNMDHPYIAKFYESYRDDDYLSLVMEYCSGSTLTDLIIERGKLEESDIKEWV
jgi:calcium-dependent protein kinase